MSRTDSHFDGMLRHLGAAYEADVAVRDGIVTLTGTLDPTTGAHGDLIPVAVRLMWDVDGVVDIMDRLGQSQPPARAQAEPSGQAG